MPEIPEIETIRRQLAQNIFGKKIVQVDLQREKTINVKKNELIDHLMNTTVTQVARRGKIIILQFNQPISLLFHFMLEGYLRFLLPDEEYEDKYQLMLEFNTGERLYFCKMYLGYIHLEITTDLESIPEIAELGPDPTDANFVLTQFQEMLKSRRKMIKPLLMEQDFLAGIGNTYSNEGLFLGGILPDRKASKLSPKEMEKLYHELRSVLERSTDLGGVGDVHFSSDDTLTGGFIPELKVSYREGEPCYVCGTPISYEKIGGRNAFFCTVCQH